MANINHLINYDELQLSAEKVTSGDIVPDKIMPGEIVLGTFIGLNEQNNPTVDFSANNGNIPIVATSTVKLIASQAGRQIALMFVEGDINKPIIMGLMYSPLDEVIDSTEQKQANINPLNSATTGIDDVRVDGQRIVLEGKEEVVLKCGDASITLTREGKISIRGKYLLNRSTGVNRIMGGTVQVN